MFQRIVEHMTKELTDPFHDDMFITESEDRFQRIVEYMTVELTDTIHDDYSSRRLRGTESGGVPPQRMKIPSPKN